MAEVSFGHAQRVVIVTGAAQGIGEACARRFAREAAHVVVGDVDDPRGQPLATELGALYVHCDVGDKAQVDAQQKVRTCLPFQPLPLCLTARVHKGDCRHHHHAVRARGR